jgi:hypothetical protein
MALIYHPNMTIDEYIEFLEKETQYCVLSKDAVVDVD